LQPWLLAVFYWFLAAADKNASGHLLKAQFAPFLRHNTG
jgi:hypothetical protein